MRALWLGIGLIGCGGPAGPDGDTDCPGDTADHWVCAGEVALDVGTGEERFADLEGGTLALIPGTQGAQHVFVSVRAPWSLDELTLDRAQATVSVWDEGARVAPALVLGVGLVPWEGGVEVTGLRVVIDPPVVDRAVTVTAELAPVGAQSRARGQADATIRWADDG